jgi:hypothetical protein
MEEVEKFLKDWIKKVSDHRPELGGFSICPYALNSKFNIVLCQENNLDDIVPIDGCDIVFFVLSDNLSLHEIQNIVEECNKKYPEWEFFEDCAKYDTFIANVKTNNGKYNLILSQPREKLKNLRLKLAKTDYYKHWDDEYLKEILQDDYNTIKNMITG